MPFADHYRGRRVLVTGSTGFKGSWLCSWLLELGAEVTGIGLPPSTSPALHSVLGLDERMRVHPQDVRDREGLASLIADLRPDTIFHLAAQALVRRSYAEPLTTLDTNVTGTANLLSAIDQAGYTADNPCKLIVVTSDKAYENRETTKAYHEDDAMGGHDLYSASKGMVELLTSAWRRSFHHPGGEATPVVRMATGRAGNVIGGGDWAPDRIVVDSVLALSRGDTIGVRNPLALRPWQHVLEPLAGYLQLACLLAQHPERLGELSSGFNFGPGSDSERSVGELADALVAAWGRGAWASQSEATALHEARYLKLMIDKSARQLMWRPTWDFETTVRNTVAWYREGYSCGFAPSVMRAYTAAQIEEFTRATHSSPSPVSESKTLASCAHE